MLKNIFTAETQSFIRYVFDATDTEVFSLCLSLRASTVIKFFSNSQYRIAFLAVCGILPILGHKKRGSALPLLYW